MLINLILEGHLEEPVAGKLLDYCGHTKGTVYGRMGCGYISTTAHRFEPMARSGCGFLVLTDFRDSGTGCPPEALKKYLLKFNSDPASSFLFRFAEAELESWLLADRQAMAGFLKISLEIIPVEPDKESFPKRSLVDLARRSRKPDIRNALVPPHNHGGPVGRGYLPVMTKFAVDFWRPGEAMNNSPSLKRCIERLRALKS